MTINKNLLDTGIGSINNLIFYIRGGTHCVRQKPENVKNPQTEKQQINRKSLTTVVRIYKKLSDTLKISFLSNKKTKHAYHMFISANLNHSIINNKIRHNLIQLSQNSQYRTYFLINFKQNKTKQINIKFINSNNNKSSRNDNLYIILTNNDFTQTKQFIKHTKRKNILTSINLSKSEEKLFKHMYIFFISENIKYIENTQYFPII